MGWGWFFSQDSKIIELTDLDWHHPDHHHCRRRHRRHRPYQRQNSTMINDLVISW